MFDPEQWGTYADWTGSLLTGLSVLAAAVIYYFDRRRERRSQAGAVLVWLHPHEHGPPTIKMRNMSDRPVFDYGFLVVSRSQGQVAKTAREGWNHGRFPWPKHNKFSHHDRHTLLNFHDGSELYLSPDKQVMYDPELQFSSAVYDYFAYFRDAAGQYWVVDARRQRPVSDWRRWRLRIGPGGLDAS
ncbi:hypothetical protein [Mycobacterium sp. NPDC050441]|uniref:hypothetical protein n=1 Tax=Mycobacterium sp. NPDC050441 TaxID=3155403 RepID=UPI00340D48A4